MRMSEESTVRSVAKCLLTGVLLIAAPASADLLTRTTIWEWSDIDALPVQSCSAEIVHRYYHPIYLEGGREGMLLFEDATETAWDKVELSYTNRAGTHRKPITVHDSDSYYHFVLASDLRDVAEFDQVYAEFTRPATAETWYNSDAVVDLLWSQWISHWCEDEDEDDRCDPIEAPDGTEFFSLPPISLTEQSSLAQCLIAHQSTKQQIVRQDYLISGSVNWPRLAQWSADCSLMLATNAPAQPDLEQPTDQELCALAHYWMTNSPPQEFLGNSERAYLCDPSKQYNDDYSGHQVRDFADQAHGTFSGFVCPAVETTSSSVLSVEDMRYDSTGLRRPPLTATRESVTIKNAPE